MEETKKLTKKSKIIIATSVITLVVFVVTFVCCWFLVDEIYNVDLDNIISEDNLVWNDEFDGTTLNTDNWRVEPSTIAGTDEVYDGLKYGEKRYRRGAYWSLDQCIVEETNDSNSPDGKANVLKIRTEQKENGEWHTGGLISDRSLAQTYGYFEMRARLPKFYGIWSAFWMMPLQGMPEDNVPDARNAKKYGSEIDIMEAPTYGRNGAGLVQQAVHNGGYGATHESTFNPRWLTTDCGDLYDSFHTYGLYWDENIYKFYIDGKCVWTTSYNRQHNVSGVPEYLFLSVEIGGEDGKVGENPWKFVVPDGKRLVTDNPSDIKYADFEVDYVRCYKIDSTTFAVNNQQA